jgi:Uri superfamily endonuclease
MPPTAPGTYRLVLRIAKHCTIRAGRLGALALDPGIYVYAGSAFGPGGLRARIAHHRRRARSPHWHIDYLRRHTRLIGIWYIEGQRMEHEWAARLAAMPGAMLAAPGFGSSDCACATHLRSFADVPDLVPVLGGAAVYALL